MATIRRSWVSAVIAGSAGLVIYAYDDWFARFDLTNTWMHRAATICEWLVLGPGMGILAFMVSENARLKDQAVRRERVVAAQQRFFALGRVAASVAHEVRNPLQNIRLLLDEVRADGGFAGQADLSDRVEINLERINRAVSLVYHLARPAGLESGGQETSDLGALVDELLLAERRRDPAAPPIARTLPSGSLMVGCSAASVRIVIDNLLRNAVAGAGKAGGVALAVRPADDAWEVVLTNPGILPAGIAGADDHEPSVVSTSGGLGLGLFISRQIAQQAGGSLRLEQRGDHVEAILTLPKEHAS